MRLEKGFRLTFMQTVLYHYAILFAKCLYLSAVSNEANYSACERGGGGHQKKGFGVIVFSPER
jgi:hypothetical protein